MGRFVDIYDRVPAHDIGAGGGPTWLLVLQGLLLAVLVIGPAVWTWSDRQKT